MVRVSVAVAPPAGAGRSFLVWCLALNVRYWDVKLGLDARGRLLAHADLDAICWRGDSAVVLAAHRTSLLQLVLDAGCDTTRLVQSRCTFGNPNAVECTRGCVSCSQATVQRALRHAKGNEECILLLKQAAA